MIVIFILLLSSLVFSQPGKMNYTHPKFSKNNFSRHINYLGSDLFEGRGTGTLGNYLASKYLAYMYSEYNLLPKGENSTYYQNIPMKGSKPLEDSELIIYETTGETQLSLYNDYLLFKSGDQTFLPVAKKMAFVGYGIIAPEYDYNDYQNINVEGKIAVMIGGEPISEDPEYFDADQPTMYSQFEIKQRIAISRGAAGCIFIPFLKSENEWQKLRRQYTFEDVQLLSSVSSNLSIIINPSLGQILFSSSPMSYDDVMRLHHFGGIKSFPLNNSLSFKGKFETREFYSSNIIGLLEGQEDNLKDTYIIVSAHYDHLGAGMPVKGDSIYNGVSDNAVGTAALLEIARMLSEARYKIKRSVLFLLTTGEEKGLLGSKYYVNHPAVPLYKSVVNINIDGIASFDNFNEMILIGGELTNIEMFCANIKSDLTFGNIPNEFNSTMAFNMSDQIAFAMAGIPSVLTIEGPNYKTMDREQAIEMFINYSTNIYHTPFDDLTQEINYNAVEQHVEFLYSLVLLIANSKNVPEWKPGVPFINARLRSIAEKR